MAENVQEKSNLSNRPSDDRDGQQDININMDNVRAFLEEAEKQINKIFKSSPSLGNLLLKALTKKLSQLAERHEELAEEHAEKLESLKEKIDELVARFENVETLRALTRQKEIDPNQKEFSFKYKGLGFSEAQEVKLEVNDLEVLQNCLIFDTNGFQDFFWEEI